jgi:hypothetical protein
LIVTVTGRLHISSRHRSRYVLGIPRVVLPAGGHLELQERRQGRWRTVASIKSGPATTFRWRNRHARHFRVIPVVRGDVRAVPSSLVRVPAR